MTVKNFIVGMGNILNIFPEPPKYLEKNPSDKEKIKSDLEEVGKEIYRSVEKVKNEYRIRD